MVAPTLIRLPQADESRLDELLNCFLSGRNPRTLEAYRTDLEDLTTFINQTDLKNLVSQFLSLSPGEANSVVLRYRNTLKDRGLQASTINRRLASIRSLVKLARTLGIITWSVEIPNLRVEAYRDTRGPGLSKFCEMIALAGNKEGKKAVRDVAILRLLFDLALRASELTNLDLSDFDPIHKTISIIAKGKSQKVILSLPEASITALAKWIDIRGKGQGPLFTNFDRAKKGNRLTKNGLYELIRNLGLKVGIKTRTHGLRHLSITEACRVAQANGFGLEEVLDHSRHTSVTVLLTYRDRERNVQGQIANLISEKLERGRSK